MKNSQQSIRYAGEHYFKFWHGERVVEEVLEFYYEREEKVKGGKARKSEKIVFCYTFRFT